MAYIGKTPVIGNFQKCDSISVVNGQAAYTLQVGGANVSPQSENHMLVSLNGILQAPVDSFTVSGSTLTFASNLVTGDVIDFVMILGNVLDLGVPSDNTVSLAKLTATGTKDATTFLRGDNTFAEAGGGKVLQVVQSIFSGGKATTSTSFVDVANASVSITPSSTSSKVLVLVNASDVQKSAAGVSGYIKIVRNSTDLISLGNQIGYTANSNWQNVGSVSGTYLDSPATTSATTYKLQFKTDNGTGTFYINSGGSDSMITVMEIAGW